MSDRIYAPWTDEQVEALNAYQTTGFFHPFTCCGENSCRDKLGTCNPDGSFNEHILIATNEGWICPTCDRKQDWAWEAMTWDLSNPFQEGES